MDIQKRINILSSTDTNDTPFIRVQMMCYKDYGYGFREYSRSRVYQTAGSKHLISLASVRRAQRLQLQMIEGGKCG